MNSVNQGKQILFYSVILVIGLFFLFNGLIEAEPVLAPLLTAVVLSIVVLPLARKVEGKFINRSVASILCAIFLFLISCAFLALISYQLKRMVNGWAVITEKMRPKIERLSAYFLEHFPLDKIIVSQYQPKNILSSTIPMSSLDRQ